jgi:hypothetical protein
VDFPGLESAVLSRFPTVQLNKAYLLNFIIALTCSIRTHAMNAPHEPESPTSNQDPAPTPCLADCEKTSKDEDKLPCSEAKRQHGICVSHGTMRTNGELRFRLNASDGSSYIRTQTTAKSKGWQRAHYHQHLRETYIVQAGWIGYVELRNGEPAYEKHHAGSVFTTSPGVVHNIYMPENAVIHTVKHGGVTNAGHPIPDWWSSADCALLMEKIGTDFAPDEEKNRKTSKSPDEDKKTYGEGYRHFDTLIWQVPVAASTLFAIVVGAANAFLTPSRTSNEGDSIRPLNLVAKEFGLSLYEFAGIQFGIFGILVAILAYAMYRFRWHQVQTRTWGRTPSSPLLSPQALLQGVVTAEAAVLLLASAYFFGWHKSGSLTLALVAVFWGQYWYFAERALRRRADTHKPPVRRHEDSSDTYPILGAS